MDVNSQDCPATDSLENLTSPNDFSDMLVFLGSYSQACFFSCALHHERVKTTGMAP